MIEREGLNIFGTADDETQEIKWISEQSKELVIVKYGGGLKMRRKK